MEPWAAFTNGLRRAERGVPGMTARKAAKGYLTKSRYAYMTIREGIVARRYLPGSPMIITALSKSLGVSETPVRDAIKMLISEGFVVSSDHVGARVASPSLEDLKNMFEILLSLQGIATRMAVYQGSGVLLEELGEILEKTKLYIHEQRHEEYGILNDRFHDSIESRCCNAELISIINSYREKTGWVRSLFVLNPKRLEESFDEHVEIFDALKNRKATRAEKILKKHLLISFNAYLGFLKKENGYEGKEYEIDGSRWI